MAKGVVFGLISCVTILPSLILIFDKLISKTMHKSLIPNMNKFSGFVTKNYLAFVIIAICLFIPSTIGYAKKPIYHDFTKILETEDGEGSNQDDILSIVADMKLKEEYGVSSTHMILCDAKMNATKATTMLSELEKVNGKVIEQIIRPTGLLDPTIEVKPINGQIDDLVGQINKKIELNERVLVTTLTIRMAEELTTYLKNLDIKVAYLHSEIKTLERLKIIRDLRLGKYDVLVGINLLREGIDIPEVSLIAIMDADKQGFLRSERSLIQTIGRAARNANGHVIMYADSISDSMDVAIKETNRRREIQEKYNKEHNIVPTTIKKEIRDVITNNKELEETKPQKMTKEEKINLMNQIEQEMKEAAKNLEFERATELRDILFELKSKQ